MMRMVAVIKKILSFFLPENEITATEIITVSWEAEEHKIKVKKKCQLEIIYLKIKSYLV
tara:strand:- start:53 stop:229 length:177 start_codon:yes stop_codon:yes gene_type:complete